MKDTVVVGRFRSRLDAETAAGLLDEASIAYVIQSAEGIGVGPLPAGASLLVHRDQADAARRILAALEPDDPS